MLNRLILLCGIVLWLPNAEAALITPPSSHDIVAKLDIYDVNGQLIHSANANGSSLYANGTATFSASSLIAPFFIHDFSVISTKGPETTVGMQLDWGVSKNIRNEATWSLIIADDFFSGTSSYFYRSGDSDGDGVPGTRLSDVPAGAQFLRSGMSVDLTLDIVPGSENPASVPIPAAFWLFLSGLLGGIGASRMRHN